MPAACGSLSVHHADPQLDRAAALIRDRDIDRRDRRLRQLGQHAVACGGVHTRIIKAHLQQDQAIKVAAAHETRQIGRLR
jgi:hypothetical protein